MADGENHTKAAKLRIVKNLPLSPELGEMYLLIDGGSNNNKIHVKTINGWIKTAALT